MRKKKATDDGGGGPSGASSTGPKKKASSKTRKSPTAVAKRVRGKGKGGRTGAKSRGDLQDASEMPGPSPVGKSPCVVVGAGASAGGLVAFKTFLGALRPGNRMAFVFVQHLDPEHQSLMAGLLSKYTEMPVRQVEASTSIEPDHVYIIPPNKYIRLASDVLHLDDPAERRGLRRPVDYFFRSLAEARAERAICIVFSGTGSDGSEGVKDVKAAGGMTLAQTPDSAEYDGMPRSAIGTGMVDFVVPVESMPEILVKYAQHSYARTGREPARLHESSPEHFKSVLGLLHAHTDYEFTCYKKGTINRRILRRMGLRQVEKLGDYLKLLRSEPSEVRSLFRDLLIGVTRFFRDQDAWQALQDEVVAPVVAGKSEGDAIRVWVPGCSTGEEAYSVAILFSEEIKRQNKKVILQLFATDLDEQAIHMGRTGTYPASIATDVSAPMLKRFFAREGEGYRVDKQLRGSTVFAVQNLVGDPPFSNLDLISCRNVLIYLESDVQKKLMRLFHFALGRRGYLFLGTSESPNRGEKLFSPASQQWRIFKKTGEQRTRQTLFPLGRSPGRRPTVARETETPSASPDLGLVETTRKILLDKFVPPSVLVDQDQEVHFFHGSLRDYLSIPAGEPTCNLGTMAVEGLRLTIRGLIREATCLKRPATAVAPRVKRDGLMVDVRVSVELLNMREAPLFLVSFRDEAPPKKDGKESSPRKTDGRRSHAADVVPQLENELQAVREDLQSTIEELATANEELRASSEEVMSTNEELQTGNEELETSREELQSLNEELITVNSQLEEKVGELESTNNDLSNLLNSTEIATIFIDTSFRIRRFTPACTKLLRIIPGDIGRAVSDLASRVNDPQLFEDARAVLDNLEPIEREVTDGDGSTFMRKILPFRTSTNKIDGVVITFTDVSNLKVAYHRCAGRERQQAAVAQLGHAALSSTDIQVVFNQAVKLVAEMLDAEYAKVLQLTPDRRELLMVAGVGWKEGLVGEATVPNSVDSQAGYTLQSVGPVVVKDLPNEKRFQGPQLLITHGVIGGISVIIGPDERPWGVLGVHTTKEGEYSIDDVHFVRSVAHVLTAAVERQRGEEERQDRLRRLRLVADAMPALIAYLDRDLVYRFCNARYRDWFGLEEKEIVGRSVVDVLGKDACAVVEPYTRRALAGEHCTLETELPYLHGPPRYVHIDYIPDVVEGGTVAGYYAMVMDISERVMQEETRSYLAALVDHSNDAIIGKDLEGNITSWNAAAERLYGYEADEVLGQSVNLLAPEGGEQVMEEILEQVRRGEAVKCLESVRRRKDGTLLDVLVTVSPICGSTGEVIGASSITHDISERVRADLELQEWADRLEERVAERTALAEKRAEDLRDLASQIAHAEQRARRQLAQVIHDDLQQLLVAAKMRLPGEGGMASGEELVSVGRLLDQALGTTRSLVGELSPPVLREGALPDVLKWLGRHMGERYTLDVETAFEGNLDDINEGTKTVIFDATRELLFNVVKHAGTTHASLRVRRNRHSLEVQVADSGKGFDPRIAREGSEGFGLFSIQERVEAFGGTWKVQSAPGQGASFLITLPLEPNRNLIPRLRQPPKKREIKRRLNTSAAVRILIVDDHKIVRDGRNGIISSQPDMEVVGEAADGEMGISLALDLEPDITLMDISMPSINGIEATREIVERLPDSIIIGLSLHDKEDMGKAIQQAGAAAYLRKDVASSTLLETIRALSNAHPESEASGRELES